MWTIQRDPVNKNLWMSGLHLWHWSLLLLEDNSIVVNRRQTVQGPIWSHPGFTLKNVSFHSGLLSLKMATIMQNLKSNVSINSIDSTKETLTDKDVNATCYPRLLQHWIIMSGANIKETCMQKLTTSESSCFWGKIWHPVMNCV